MGGAAKGWEIGDSLRILPEFGDCPPISVWLSGEVMRIKRSPYGSIIYPYTGGLTGWAPTAQLIFGF